MNLITPPTKQAEMFCGLNQKRDGVIYKKTQYCLETECNDGLLLYNSLTGALLLLEQNEDIAKYEDLLIKYRFMLSNEIDECVFADDFRSFLKLINPDKRIKTSFTILTTTDCNARCFYCYELGRKRVSMTQKTAEDVARYIAEESAGNPVKLSWFGGEPLINFEAIDTIISGLNDMGILFSSKIITNGFYLNQSVAHKAKNEWNTERVQITLDGSEKIYNSTKAYIDKDVVNPFLRIMDHIGYALDEGMQVHIRLNMDRENADDLWYLCDSLSDRFGSRGNFKVNVSLLRKFIGEIHQFSAEEEAAARFLTLKEKLEHDGLSSLGRLERKIRSNKCMADSDSCEVILPDGTVGKCEHFSESELIGNIYDQYRDENQIKSWKELAKPFDECRKCALYPRCYNLKKCDWDKDGCPLSVRIIRTELLKKQILQEYQRWQQDNSF